VTMLAVLMEFSVLVVADRLKSYGEGLQSFSIIIKLVELVEAQKLLKPKFRLRLFQSNDAPRSGCRCGSNN
jgi:hypothetical protein